jgi:non-specific serine/threonine protein kinase
VTGEKVALAFSPHGRLLALEATALPAAVRAAIAHGDDGVALLQLALLPDDESRDAATAFARSIGRIAVDTARAHPAAWDRGEPLIVDRVAVDALAARVPPMPGAEYVTGEIVASLAELTEKALREQTAGKTLETFIARKAPQLSVVGRVCFHLAENKRDPEHPFAFLATYASGVSAESGEAARVRHRPLGEALREYAAAENRTLLEGLLEPVRRATAESPLARSLLADRTLFHPLAWTARQAHEFLRDIPALEAAGVVVRVPNWWNKARPTRPTLTVTVGSKPAAAIGTDAMLDVSAVLTLDGEPLTEAERTSLLAASASLVMLRGKWVEVDRDRLQAVLDHWKTAERAVKKGGMTFAEAMRLLAGTSDGALTGALDDSTAGWSVVEAGPWLDDVLARLRDPSKGVAPSANVRATLRGYQEAGVRWLYLLASLGLGGCLADDMGLGKTVQLIALLTLLDRGPHLLVVPASLVGNWQRELARFAPSLRVLPIAKQTDREALDHHDVAIVTYAMLPRVAWLSEIEFRTVTLDEAQAIKNPGALQTRAAKKLKSHARFALTGTPVENRLGDLWSLFDFATPGLLGSTKTFTTLTKRLEEDPRGFAPLRALLQPYLLRRLKSDKRIVSDLPDKTEVRVETGLTKVQAALYRDSVDSLARALDESEGKPAFERRGMILSYLLRLKQICNHPSQWLGDGDFAPEKSGKMLRLAEICEEIAARQEKVLVFTQFRTMVEPLASQLASIFGRPGVVLHGETAPKKRMTLVDEFQREGGAPFFVLSLKAGGSGLNLTAATHVIHFDRWWNPAVEDQATDRAYRIGQKRNVLVHKMVCRGTIEERIDQMLGDKRATASAVLAGGEELDVAGLSRDDLMRIVALDIGSALLEDDS